jgi:hypothetical protein
VTAEQLLNRTVLYKVGHHGSHNATLRAQGLEMMTDTRLAAMVPVDEYIAHVKKRWTKMPFLPLMSQLQEKTVGRLLQADKDPPAVQFPGCVSVSKKTIAVTVDDNGRKADRPLYVEYLL